MQKGITRRLHNFGILKLVRGIDVRNGHFIFNN